MTTWKNHRQEPYFTFVKEGKKTVEGRLAKGKYAEIKAGDHIIVQTEDETDSFEVIVTGTSRYDSFQEMLVGEGLEKVLPDAIDIEDGVLKYRKFYSEDKEKEYGVVAIRVKLI